MNETIKTFLSTSALVIGALAVIFGSVTWCFNHTHFDPYYEDAQNCLAQNSKCQNLLSDDSIAMRQIIKQAAHKR